MSDAMQPRKELPILVLLLLPFLTLPFVWDQLPDQVPIHWNIEGTADGFAGKTMGLLLLPLVSVAVYALFWLIPVIDPKRRVSMRNKPMPALRNLLIFVFAFLFFVNLGSMLGVGLLGGSRNLAHLGILLLFAALGNYLPAVPPNYFVGVRTPWTLEDPEIWRRTHRLAGRVWVASALVLLVVWALLPAATFSRILFYTVIGVMALVPVGYSLYLYLRRPRPAAQED